MYLGAEFNLGAEFTCELGFILGLDVFGSWVSFGGWIYLGAGFHLGDEFICELDFIWGRVVCFVERLALIRHRIVALYISHPRSQSRSPVVIHSV